MKAVSEDGEAFEAQPLGRPDSRVSLPCGPGGMGSTALGRAAVTDWPDLCGLPSAAELKAVLPGSHTRHSVPSPVADTPMPIAVGCGIYTGGAVSDRDGVGQPGGPFGPRSLRTLLRRPPLPPRNP